jgi:hypothetical protein
MGRAFSKKQIKDVETAAESVIPVGLAGSTLSKTDDAASKLSATAGMAADRPFDDDVEKRSKHKK